MNLKQKIEADVKEALRSHDELVLSVLRMLLAAVQNFEIEKQKELTGEEVVQVLQRQVKSHKESITAFTGGKREDLAAKETKELAILSKYLPEQLSPEELKKIVTEVISQLNAGPADFGRVMSTVMGKVKGKTDGNQVSQIVKEQLEKEIKEH